MRLASTPALPQPLGSIAVLIPAWKPDKSLAAVVELLIDSHFGAIVLVDDGNGVNGRELLKELAAWPTVHVVAHALNRGKGRALKTGFKFCLTQLSTIEGVVTADADGQHLPADIARVAATLAAGAGDRLILGVREFGASVPMRSRLGNGLTRIIFGVVTGSWLKDTQTGLRGIPCALLPTLMLLGGERYEYEMSMLAHICRTGVTTTTGSADTQTFTIYKNPTQTGSTVTGGTSTGLTCSFTSGTVFAERATCSAFSPQVQLVPGDAIYIGLTQGNTTPFVKDGITLVCQ